MSSLRGGLSWVASARQRNVSLPVPHSLILDMSWSRRPGVRVTFVVPTRRYWHRSITLSGAPCVCGGRDLNGTREKSKITADESNIKYYCLYCCGGSIGSCLDKHLALRARLDGGTVHRHGLAVPRELQGKLLLHQLPDHLLDEQEGESDKEPELQLSIYSWAAVRLAASGWLRGLTELLAAEGQYFGVSTKPPCLAVLLLFVHDVTSW